MDIAAWLRELGLEQYEAAFRSNAVDAAVLPKLDADDLKDIGVVAVGHRRKLLEAIAALRCSDAPPAQAPVPGGGEGGERRQVTVLFSDVAGYTRLSTELDAEDLHALRKAFSDAVEGAVAVHGGTIERHIGDSVMAVFGVPRAHDNDPERAVRAGLAIREAMPALTQRFGRDIAVHTGIASGEVVATGAGGPGNPFSVTGESVNLASRLTGAAAAGEILVSAAVRRALTDRLDASPVGLLAVKGFAEPVEAWRVAALRRSAAERHRLIGRRGEMLQLEAAISACREGGHGQTIHIRGEAGIGKTRLVGEFAGRAAAAGFVCHTGWALDFGGGSGRDLLRTVVRSLVGAAGEPDDAAVAALADRAVATGLLPAARRMFLADLLDLPQAPDQRLTYEALDNRTRSQGRLETVAELAAALARSAPLLIAAEDVHWAEPATLDGLDAIAAAASEAPVLLALTSRLEGDPVRGGWQPQGALLTIDLAPLRREEARAFADDFRAAASAYTERCIERAAGNPLFLEQLLRNADQQAQAVPDSVQSLVQARVDRLAPEDRAALQAASIFGQKFALAGVRVLLDSPGYDPRALVAHFLVRPIGDEFLFVHALVRDAVYATLLRSRRRELHRRAADWFATADPPLRAEHLEQAGDAGAPAAYVAAARNQAGLYRYERALHLIERSEALAQDRPERFAAIAYRGELLHDMGTVAEARTAFEQALAIAADDAERCRVWLGLAAVKRITEDMDGALADVARVEEAAARLHLPGEASRAHYLHGNLSFFRGDMESCLREHQRSYELAREAGSGELEAAALGGLGDALYMRGLMISACDSFRRCMAVAEAAGLDRIAVANSGMTAITLCFFAPVAEALDQARRAVAAATRVGHLRAETIAHHANFFCLHTLGEVDAAQPHVDRALALARHLRARRFEGEALAFHGELCRMRGDHAGADAALEEALAASRETGLAYLGPYVLGLVAQNARVDAQRRSALAEGEALLAVNQIGHNHYLFRRSAIDACLAARDWDGVDRHAQALAQFAAREPTHWATFVVARGRALAAAGRGFGEPDALKRLRVEAGERGYRSALAELEAAAS